MVLCILIFKFLEYGKADFEQKGTKHSPYLNCSNFFVNATLICYSCSQLHALCIFVMRHDQALFRNVWGKIYRTQEGKWYMLYTII
jgi:hypothetical protein